MMLRGFVKDGVVVPYDPSGLVEGAEVDFSLRRGKAKSKARSVLKKAPVKKVKSKAKKVGSASAVKKRKKKETLRELLEGFTGVMKGLPRDLARNHDHYLYGTPRKP